MTWNWYENFLKLILLTLFWKAHKFIIIALKIPAFIKEWENFIMKNSNGTKHRFFVTFSFTFYLATFYFIFEWWKILHQLGLG